MADQLNGLFVHTQLPGDDLGVAADAHYVPPRLVIPELRRPGQAVNQFQPRGGQFRGPSTNLLLQIPGVVLQVIVVCLDQQGVTYADDQLSGVHGLAQKIRRPQLQSLHFGLLIVGSSQHDRRNMHQLLVLAQLSQDLQSANERHHDVDQDDVGHFLRDHLHDRPGIGARHEVLIPGELEVLLHDLDVHRFIVDDHHLGRLAQRSDYRVRPKRDRSRRSFIRGIRRALAPCCLQLRLAEWRLQIEVLHHRVSFKKATVRVLLGKNRLLFRSAMSAR